MFSTREAYDYIRDGKKDKVELNEYYCEICLQTTMFECYEGWYLDSYSYSICTKCGNKNCCL